MALATQCPHCQTTFRVAHDQLKLRSGLVRCGGCKEIFNGIENLLRPDAPARPTVGAKPTPPVMPVAPIKPEAPNFELRPPALATTPADQSLQQPGVEPEKNSTDLNAAEGADTAGQPAGKLAVSPATLLTIPSSLVEFITDPLATPLAEPPKSTAPWAPLPPTGLPPRQPPAAPVAPSTPWPSLNQFTNDQPKAAAPTVSSAAHPRFPADDSDDPMMRMTLMDFSDTFTPAPANLVPSTATGSAPATASNATVPPVLANDVQLDDLDAAIENLRRSARNKKKSPAKRRSSAHDESEHAEPGFLKSTRRRQRIGRTTQTVLRVTSLLLLICLTAQVIYAFRDQIAARIPASKPFIAQACQLLGCHIALPMQIDLVSIETSELQAVPGARNVLMLTSLLRNRSTTAQAWPSIELTLNDGSDQPLVRRVFLPKDYLTSATELNSGFAAGAEQPLKIVFELLQTKASGYRVYLFYP